MIKNENNVLKRAVLVLKCSLPEKIKERLSWEAGNGKTELVYIESEKKQENLLHVQVKKGRRELQYPEIEKIQRNLLHLENKKAAEEEKQRTLWITDLADFGRKLVKEGRYVLFFLTEENENDSFGISPYCICDPEALSVSYMEKIVRRYRKIPWDILETERLIVREAGEKDLDALYQIHEGESAQKWLEELDADRQEEGERLKAYIQNIYGFYEYGMWLLVEKESGEVIGRAGLQIAGEQGEPELGFAVRDEFQKKGYAFEACTAILKYAREELELDEIRALAEEGNTASKRLLHKLGFQYMKETETRLLKGCQRVYRVYCKNLREDFFSSKSQSPESDFHREV